MQPKCTSAELCFPYRLLSGTPKEIRLLYKLKFGNRCGEISQQSSFNQLRSFNHSIGAIRRAVGSTVCTAHLLDVPPEASDSPNSHRYQ